jgi:hypothetical protein
MCKEGRVNLIIKKSSAFSNEFVTGSSHVPIRLTLSALSMGHFIKSELSYLSTNARRMYLQHFGQIPEQK